MTPEEAVIGACLLDSNVIREAVQHVMPSDFATWQGQEIYQAILDLHAVREPVDVVTVSSRLLRNGSKVNVSVLHTIINKVPSASAIGYYAQQVREAAVKRALRVAGLKIIQDAESEVTQSGVAVADALNNLKAIRDDAPITGLPTFTLGELMAEEDHYDWVIKHLFERQDRLILTGSKPGIGKSTLLRQVAILSACGIHPLWLRPIEPVNVLIIDRENTKNQWRRKARPLWNLALQHGTRSPENIQMSCIPAPMDITRDSDLGKIHKLLDEHPADLLCLGPLYRLVPRAIQTDDEAAPVIAALDSLRERGCVIITEAHAGHGTEKGDLHPRGSAALSGWPEFGFGLRKIETQPGQVRLERWRGDRDQRDFPQVLVSGGPVPWLPEELPESVLAKFREPQQGMSW